MAEEVDKVDKIDNPLDDDLLMELGLEPKEIPQPPKAPTLNQGVKPPPPLRTDKSLPRENIPRTAPSPPPLKSKSDVAEASERFQAGLKGLAEDMPVQVVAVLGKRSMSIKDLLALKQGEIIELKKLPQEAIDLVANGKLMARGELVLIDGKLGIQIKQLVS